MDKVLGNYTGQTNNDFPLDCETLEYLKEHAMMCEVLGAIGGDKIILSGCTGTTRSEGYVFLKTTARPEGEVLRFEGGAGTTLYVNEESVSVTAEGVTYSQAYKKRTLKAGTGSEQYNWSDFTDISNITNKALKSDITTKNTALTTLINDNVPVGTIVLWPKSTLPSGDLWKFCLNTTLNYSLYTELDALLGHNAYGFINLPSLADVGTCKYIIKVSKTPVVIATA